MKTPLKSLIDEQLKTPNKAKMDEVSKQEVLKNISDLSLKVTQFKATEQPFQNSYWDYDEEGIYVDVISGKPLFSSKDKFDSGCGWPSFTKPVEGEAVTYEMDESHFMKRVEVKSQFSEAHLGHVFDDGIEPTGLRYCINSAALKFIPKTQMVSLGYENYLYLFEMTK